MAYSTRWLEEEGGGFELPYKCRYAGFHDGVLYRKMAIRKEHFLAGSGELDLAEIIIPGGMIRVDRLRMPYPHELHLGHFGLPHTGSKPHMERREVEGYLSISAAIPDRRLAVTAIRGWDDVKATTHLGLNAEAPDSTVLLATRRRERWFAGLDLLVTIMLHRKDDRDWTGDELMPIRSMEYLPWAPSGSPCGLALVLKSNRNFLVDFRALDGALQD
jgi:hypothetical protein